MRTLLGGMLAAGGLVSFPASAQPVSVGAIRVDARLLGSQGWGENAPRIARAMERELARELAPLRRNAMDDHPWRDWAGASAQSSRMPGAQSRWSAGKDLSWEPLRIERVCEVKYDHMQGDRFRHAAQFVRWRPDKRPQDCGYDQLEVTKPYELERIFSSGSSGS